MIWFILFIFFMLFILLNVMYMHTNAYRNLKACFHRFDEKIPDGLEMVNVGSGPSFYAMDYDEVPVRGFNFAVPPQSAYHDFALLKHYRDKIAEGAIIYIFITCPLSFAKNKFHDQVDYRCRYYGILDATEVDGGSKAEAFLYRYFPLLLCPKRVVRLIWDVPKADLTESDVNLEKDAEHMLRGWRANNYIQDLKDTGQSEAHQEEFERIIETYKEMLKLCRKRGWKPYFVIPPVSLPIRKMISPEFRKVFVTDNLIRANREHIPVLDYSDDDRFSDDKYFMNSMFLNQCGRRRFMKILCEDVNYKRNI